MNNLSWIKGIKFLCFDVDGTLYRSVPDIWDAIQSQIYDLVAKKNNWSPKRTKQEFDRLYKKLGSSTKVLEFFHLDAKEFFNTTFAKLDFAKFIHHDKLLLQLINQLKKKYIVGILSNGGKESVTKKLSVLGLSPDQFSPFLTTYEYGALKPDPAPFLQAIEDAGVKPEESVYIGDKEETDILGASAVGMHTIMAWGKSEKADLSIPEIYDLEAYFLASTGMKGTVPYKPVTAI